MDWQPIETAPRDEWIIGRNKFHGSYPCIFIDGWVSAQNLEYYYIHSHTSRYDDEPIHWMPLPEPPK